MFGFVIYKQLYVHITFNIFWINFCVKCEQTWPNVMKSELNISKWTSRADTVYVL